MQLIKRFLNWMFGEKIEPVKVPQSDWELGGEAMVRDFSKEGEANVA